MSIVESKPQPPFATSDTALAAWLCLKGIHYSHTNFKPHKAETDIEFVFPRDGAKLDELRDAFQAGEAYGNVVAYIRHYHILVQKANKAKGSFR